MNPLLGRGFTRNVKPYFLRKIKVIISVAYAAILLGALRVNVSLVECTHVLSDKGLEVHNWPDIVSCGLRLIKSMMGLRPRL